MTHIILQKVNALESDFMPLTLKKGGFLSITE